MGARCHAPCDLQVDEAGLGIHETVHGQKALMDIGEIACIELDLQGPEADTQALDMALREKEPAPVRRGDLVKAVRQ